MGRGVLTAAQFAGGVAGVVFSEAFGSGCAMLVNYVVTVPGPRAWVAFGAEFAISFVLMAMVLGRRIPSASRFTPLWPAFW